MPFSKRRLLFHFRSFSEQNGTCISFGNVAGGRGDGAKRRKAAQQAIKSAANMDVMRIRHAPLLGGGVEGREWSVSRAKILQKSKNIAVKRGQDSWAKVPKGQGGGKDIGHISGEWRAGKPSGAGQ